MGNGMNKVLPGLYVGNFRDARDQQQLQENNITHIISIHDNARPSLPDKVYLCIAANDIDTQDLAQYFSQTNDFIHRARLNGGNVLVHCLAGVSRSVTITTAYVMTVTGLGWREALNAVRGSRRCANPNFGFQRQLLNFQHERLDQEKERLKISFAPSPFAEEDLRECQRLQEARREWVHHGDHTSTSSKDNSEDDETTYPLAHNAFGKTANAVKNKPTQVVQSQSSDPSTHQEDNELVDDMFGQPLKTSTSLVGGEAVKDEKQSQRSTEQSSTGCESSTTIEQLFAS